MKLPAVFILCVNRFLHCAPKAVMAWQPYRAYGRTRCSDPFEDPPKAHCAGPTPITITQAENCAPTCQFENTRMDNLYYQTTDKRQMNYEQTWCDFPDIPKRPKLRACEVDLLVPIKRRNPNQRKPSTATCPPGKSCPKIESRGPCISISLPGCKPGRYPPTCIAAKGATGCKKYCTPYPSFSECQKKKPKPKRQVECTCMTNASLCDVWKILDEQKRIKK